MGTLYAATLGQSPGVALVYIYTYICIGQTCKRTAKETCFGFPDNLAK
jgi:hypothetical protein